MMEQVIFYTILMGFLITVLLSPIFIPFLRRLKFGQSIRKEGPKSHQKKSGTPTMGGIVILLSIIITTLVMTGKFSKPNVETYLLLFVTVGFGLLGFLDDFIKVVMKRNLGLTSKQKLLGQIIISVIFIFSISSIIIQRSCPFHLRIYRSIWTGCMYCLLFFGLLVFPMPSI